MKLLFILFLVFFGNAADAEPDTCLSYDPSISSLSGVLIKEIFPGPPNYRSIENGDIKEEALIIKVETHFCVKSSPDDDVNNDDEVNQSKLQLIIHDASLWPKIHIFVGRKVKVTGTLFHAISGHHRTPVLMTLKEIEGL